MEAPNTISGLVRKRKELTDLRERLQRELVKLAKDIDHIDGALALFRAEQPSPLRARYAPKYRARHGECRRFVLAAVRASSEPVSSRAITNAWIAERNLPSDDATLTLIQDRVSSRLSELAKQGKIEKAGRQSIYAVWRLAPQLAITPVPQVAGDLNRPANGHGDRREQRPLRITATEPRQKD